MNSEEDLNLADSEAVFDEVTDTEVLDTIFAFLENEETVNITLAGYFNKVVN